MKKRTILILLSISFILSIFMFSYEGFKEQEITTFGPELLVRGKTGGDVYELQGRLKYLGYYKGNIDGIFGNQTYWAVRNFQYNFGMKVDGIVGSKTKDMLLRATKNYKPTTSTRTYSTGQFTVNEINLMAKAVYGEARGEPYTGQVAVAAVILNRIKSPAFPNSPSGVIYEPGAFTAVSDGQIWLDANETAKNAVRDAIAGWDPSGGAIYYFNPNTATNAWIWSRPQIKRIGKHIFCK